jgi:hypothetical protein
LGVALATVAGTLGVTAGGALAAPPSTAPLQFGACDDATLTQPFAPYGDLALYKLLQGGDFEAGAPDWAFDGGAAIVSGGSSGQASAAIPAGSSVTSPTTCVNAAYPKLRFFVRSGGRVPGAQLRVELVYGSGPLSQHSVPAGIVTAADDWSPSRAMATLAIAGGVQTGGEADVALRFTAVRGDWAIDDVFVDPYRRG